ncbi:metallophosphoesterase family protein [Microbacter margulisiae]|uniref:Putative MPP superfamily phosphohydrolase n=1 Tax=Microbacter margulisiae TaxID=1350067 RepID=A0A7W5H226_9PORP|nr:metallophosphoesterase [Microbacter margulisiae]MBB3188238.1 putative MPP superfamily phosphohydrolase [Microbacter margulisiae]
MNKLNRVLLILLFSLAFVSCGEMPVNAQSHHTIHIVYTSDLHFGWHRQFRGKTNCSANEVNRDMVREMNTLSEICFPKDGGIDQGSKVGPVDYIIVTGDIVNRQQIGIQSATASWKQFAATYLDGGITLKNEDGKPTPFLLECGNHDVSDAIGFTKPMNPDSDATSMVNIYNMMLSPSVPLTNATFHYKEDKINSSRDIAGVHFMFVNVWPDSTARIWMQHDLASVSSKTPVVIFTHDPPIADPKHFINPNGNHSINATDKFENILEEIFKDGKTPKSSTTIEQRGFVSFLKLHPNIRAYFHGHDNFNQFYTYYGPDDNIQLPVFRVDSPMKGDISGTDAPNKVGDEKEVSFQVISINSDTKKMTVRECFWNKSGANSKLEWGNNATIDLK